MTKSLIGWITLGLAALLWEGLGLKGVDGIAPLTDIVWHYEELFPSVGPLVVIMAIIGFPAWLVYHFLIQRKRKV